MNEKLFYLQSIQNVITRLANNSFIIKGWTITLIAAMFAITGKDIVTNKNLVLFGCFPAFFFWLLDGYYLSLERRFKKLYDATRLPDGEINFSLEIKQYKSSIGKAIFSLPLLIFYGALIITIILINCFLK